MFPPTDPTLTLPKLTQLLHSVGNLDEVRDWLGMPDSVYRAIEEQQEVDGVSRWYLTNHPAPSWGGLAEVLYEAGEPEVLQTLREQVHYLKGVSHAMCV